MGLTGGEKLFFRYCCTFAYICLLKYTLNTYLSNINIPKIILNSFDYSIKIFDNIIFYFLIIFDYSIVLRAQTKLQSKIVT